MAVSLSTLVSQSVTIPNGTRSFGPVAIAQGVRNIEIELDVASWPQNCTVDVRFELSLDGGQTFPFVNLEDGASPPRAKPGFGSNVYWTWSLMGPELTTRQARLTVTVKRGPLPTTVTLRSRAVD